MAFKIISTWEDNAGKILQDHPNRDVLINTLFSILKLMEINDWQGACHVTCGIIHVLLTEQGIENNLVLGEAKIGPAYFNHSWIEIDGQVYDMAIGNTLVHGLKSSPVFNGYDVDTTEVTQVEYAVNSGLEDDPPTIFVKSQSLGSFLNKGPVHPQHGFWIGIPDIGKRLGLELNLIQLKAKYSKVNWSVK